MPRHVVTLALWLTAFAVAGSAAELTVLLDFDATRTQRQIIAPKALEAMKSEINSVLAGRTQKPVQVELKFKSDMKPRENFEDVVLVKMKGTCKMENLAPLFDERGPYAWTHTVDGEILPFSEVACDRVRRAVSEAMWGGERKNRDTLFGRALGRILAHELMHILNHEHDHDHAGVFKRALTPRELIDQKFLP